MAGDLSISTLGGAFISDRNAIINGNFSVNQRAVSGTVTLGAGAYGHDRWKAGAGGCTYTFATVNNVTTLTISAGTLMQVIEGINLQSGTYTLSWTGTATGRVDSGSYGASGTTGTAVGGTNQTVEFGTGTLSKVQYEPGNTVTDFVRRQYGTELALCQRYAYAPYSGETATNLPMMLANPYSATQFYASLSLPVAMRSAPTLSSFTVGNLALGYPANVTLSTLSLTVATKTFVTLQGTTAGHSATQVYTIYRPGTTENPMFLAEL